MSDLIEKRDFRTRARKRKKREMDSVIGLSYRDEEKNAMCLSVDIKKLSDTKIRLLDEGYFDNGFLIKKGAMEKFYNGKNEKVRGWEFNGEEWTRTEVLNLTSDFVGTVNLGHMDFATFPYIIGEWKKEDLELVDIENDRKALDVELRLDEESIFVKELKRQPYDIGVSAEFWYSVDEEATEQLSEMLGYYIPVFDEIFIFAYGLVGECGNVNSSGLELKGGSGMAEDKKPMEEVIQPTEEPTEEPMEETVTEETEVTETVTEEPMEETVEEAIEAEEAAEDIEDVPAEDGDGEEVESEEDTEEGADEAEDDEADLEEVLSVVNDLREQVAQLEATVASLTEANAKLKKSNKKLTSKLDEEKSKKEAFIKNAKSISVKLGVNEDKPKKRVVADEKFAFGDGIGD